MKQGRTDRDWAVVAVMTFAAGCLFVWALMSKQPSIPATLKKELPAWVQAIGSIAAILVAIYVPWRQRQNSINDEKAKDAAKRLIIAAALYPALGQFQTMLHNLLHFADRDFEARKQLPEDGIRRPIEFDQFRQDLYLLGELGHRINLIIGAHDHVWNASRTLQSYPLVDPVMRARMTAEFPALASEIENCMARLLQEFGR